LTGAAALQSDARMEAARVGRRFTIGVALAAGAVALVALAARPVPELALRLLGGPSGIERWGGLRVGYRQPDGALRQLDLPRLPEAAVPDALELLGGELSLHEVLESDRAARAAERLEPRAAEGEAVAAQGGQPSSLQLDLWVDRETGQRHQASYLEAPSRQALEESFQAAAARGWSAEGARLAYGQERGDDGEPPWRSYELAAEPALDHRHVAEARTGISEVDGHPTVQVELTAEGAARFCELTARLLGRKVAIVIGDRVWTAPIINGRICGGRFEITMWGVRSPDEAPALAAALAAVLNHGRGLAPGGVIATQR
jgi:hypothetical protein